MHSLERHARGQWTGPRKESGSGERKRERERGERESERERGDGDLVHTASISGPNSVHLSIAYTAPSYSFDLLAPYAGALNPPHSLVYRRRCSSLSFRYVVGSQPGLKFKWGGVHIPLLARSLLSRRQPPTSRFLLYLSLPPSSPALNLKASEGGREATTARTAAPYYHIQTGSGGDWTKKGERRLHAFSTDVAASFF